MGTQLKGGAPENSQYFVLKVLCYGQGCECYLGSVVLEPLGLHLPELEGPLG